MNFKRKNQFKELLISSPKELYEKLETELKKDSGKLGELTQLRSRYERLSRENIMNLISNSEYETKISKLTLASTLFLDSLHNEDLKSELFDEDLHRYYLDDEVLPDENYFKMIEYKSAVYKKLKGGSGGKELEDFLESFLQTFQARMEYYCELFGTEYKFKTYKQLNITKCTSDDKTYFVILKMESSSSKHLLVVLKDTYDLYSDKPLKRKTKRYIEKYSYGLNSNHEIAWKFKEGEFLNNKELADLIIKNIQGVYYRLILAEFEGISKKNSSEQDSFKGKKIKRLRKKTHQ